MSVDRALLRKELERPGGRSDVTVEEALNAVIIRNGEKDYSLKVSGDGGGGGGGDSTAGGLIPEAFTSVTQTLPAPAANVEEYVYALVPSGSATITVTYEDSTKKTLVSAVRS